MERLRNGQVIYRTPFPAGKDHRGRIPARAEARAEAAENEARERITISWTLSDRNKDGNLSEDEVSEEEWEFLAQADTNGDGAVTREEAKEDVERERSVQKALFAKGQQDLRKQIMALSHDQCRDLFKAAKDRLRAKPDLTGEELRELLGEGLKSL